MIPMQLASLLKASVIVLILGGITACDEYPPPPTPLLSPTPRPTILPEATAGQLTNVEVPQMALSLLMPSNWKPPVYQDNSNFILSPDGSTNTSYTAGPFVIVRVGDNAYFQKLLAFQSTLTDPQPRLDAMVTAINRDASSFGLSQPYTGAKYPGAMTTGFERDNVLTIVLLKAGADRWIYIGTQSKEVNFTYYESAVFEPLINSLTLH